MQKNDKGQMRELRFCEDWSEEVSLLLKLRKSPQPRKMTQSKWIRRTGVHNFFFKKQVDLELVT